MVKQRDLFILAGVAGAIGIFLLSQRTQPACQDGEVELADCADGSQIITRRCTNGQWVDTGAQCPGEPVISAQVVDILVS